MGAAVPVREYVVIEPSTPYAVREAVANSVLDGRSVVVDAEEVVDELSARRGGRAVRHFIFQVLTVDVVEGLHVNAQDTTTLEWASLIINDERATITVVSL